MIALYGDQQQVNGLSLREAVTFVAVSQGMIAFLFIFGTWDVMSTVYSGSIGADLLKPLHLFTFWMARDLGRALVNLVVRGVLLLALFCAGLPNCCSQPVGAVAGAAPGDGAGLAGQFCLAFPGQPGGLLDAGRARHRADCIYGFELLSGFIMPLRLYPDWFANLCHLTPFPALFNTPVEVYLGLLAGQELGLALLDQVFWFLALAALSELALRAGVRRLVIQGG